MCAFWIKIDDDDIRGGVFRFNPKSPVTSPPPKRGSREKSPEGKQVEFHKVGR